MSSRHRVDNKILYARNVFRFNVSHWHVSLKIRTCAYSTEEEVRQMLYSLHVKLNFLSNSMICRFDPNTHSPIQVILLSSCDDHQLGMTFFQCAKQCMALYLTWPHIFLNHYLINTIWYLLHFVMLICTVTLPYKIAETLSSNTNINHIQWRLSVAYSMLGIKYIQLSLKLCSSMVMFEPLILHDFFWSRCWIVLFTRK